MVHERANATFVRAEPHRGLPETPPTAIGSAVPSPSRLTGLRYTPCTCSRREGVQRQRRTALLPFSMGHIGMVRTPSLWWMDDTRPRISSLDSIRIGSRMSSECTSLGARQRLILLAHC